MIKPEKTNAAECAVCKITTDQKSHHLPSDGILPGRRLAGWPSSEEATESSLVPHPRCASCGILMGPGHIEAGTDRFCGTCAATRRANDQADGSPARPVYGQRGWRNDQTLRRYTEPRA